MAFSDPKKNIQAFGLQRGSVVADFGAGAGHYSKAASRMVGENGRVYAVEIQRELLSRLKRDVVDEGLKNVDIVLGDLEEKGGSGLADNSVDAVMMTNVLFQAEHRSGFIEEAARVLKRDGKVLFVDWSESFGNLGPRVEDVIAPDRARALFTEQGFSVEREFDAGEHHYGLVLKKT